MSTSGSYNFNVQCNALINHALQLLAIYGVGRTVSDEDMAFCRIALNLMIKSWATQGLHLWARGNGVLHLDQYVGSYSLGNAATDAHVTSSDDEVVTQLNGAAAAAATSLTVDSTTGMTVGDKIGVVLSSLDIFWTTIATIPTSTTLTISSGLTTAASDNAIVYTYTSRIYKPLRILSAQLITGIDSGSTSTQREITLAAVGYDQYAQMPAKTQNSSSPIQFSYLPGETSGTLYLWPRPTDTSARITFTYDRLLQDLDTATDDLDLPAEWLEPIAYQLALRIAPAFGKGKKAREELEGMASSLLQTLKDWDNEITSFYILPNFEG